MEKNVGARGLAEPQSPGPPASVRMESSTRTENHPCSAFEAAASERLTEAVTLGSTQSSDRFSQMTAKCR